MKGLRRLSSIRGQLVVWYLAILAVLLVALGVFQSITLRDYLRTSTAHSVRSSAYGALSLLGPCYLRSAGDLETNAITLARLLGGPDTSVMIVNRTGETLASHDAIVGGTALPLRLSSSTVHSLIAGVGKGGYSPSLSSSISCPRPRPSTSATGRSGRGDSGRRDAGVPVPGFATSLVSGGTVLLVAVPLGPPGKPLGYAILGRSMSAANAIAGRLVLVFGLGAIAALLLAASIAMPIINRALSPLRRVTETAETIAGGDLEARADLSHTQDEVGRLGVAFDSMVDRLQQALSATAASEERMRRFLADASHELRTPVTVLRGSSQVLLRHADVHDPQLIDALRDMNEEAVRLARLIDDLLTLTRLDASSELVPQRIPVLEFVREFVDRYAQVWAGREIETGVGSLDGAVAIADPEALRRILTNLVENAARYSRPGGRIWIDGAVHDNTVQIAVRDEGPGLAPEDAEHVFERFYTANKSRSRSSGGTGLGLSIVRGLVEGSGGTISIDTALDRGTTVTFTLPSARTDGIAAAQQPISTSTPAR
jgi:two-component system OmpR family sensor kinase